ncbi:MAG: hypothetical protein ABL888_20945 [Pirellulaceae bacterium]
MGFRQHEFLKLKPSRKKQKTGDIFVWRISSYPKYYGVGRVIDPDANCAGDRMPLIALFKYQLKSIDEIPEVLPAKDMIGCPYFVGNASWALGWFQTVASREFAEPEKFKNLVFLQQRSIRRFYNEKFEEIKGITRKPKGCGECVIHIGLTYKIEMAINKAWEKNKDR